METTCRSRSPAKYVRDELLERYELAEKPNTVTTSKKIETRTETKTRAHKECYNSVNNEEEKLDNLCVYCHTPVRDEEGKRHHSPEKSNKIESNTMRKSSEINNSTR